jgi:hypothetical protein
MPQARYDLKLWIGSLHKSVTHPPMLPGHGTRYEDVLTVRSRHILDHTDSVRTSDVRANRRPTSSPTLAGAVLSAVS